MSHFAVLVAETKGNTLEEIMLPFHEYECTGIEKYLQFVPCDQDELKKDFAEHGEGRALEEFASDWGNYVKDSAGVFGKLTNPNAKWDWYQVGGRWDGFLKMNFGKKSELGIDLLRRSCLQ